MAIKSWPYPPADGGDVTAYLKRLYSALVEYTVQQDISKPSKLDAVASDPDTTKWGATDAGRIWYNTGDAKVKYWDGGSIVEL